jgi:hypothetical protein
MDKEKAVSLLRGGRVGIKAFNAYRVANPDWTPDLAFVALRARMDGVNLAKANMFCTMMEGAGLRYADLRGAYLGDAVLSYADIRGAKLEGADFGGTYMLCTIVTQEQADALRGRGASELERISIQGPAD